MHAAAHEAAHAALSPEREGGEQKRKEKNASNTKTSNPREVFV